MKLTAWLVTNFKKRYLAFACCSFQRLANLCRSLMADKPTLLFNYNASNCIFVGPIANLKGHYFQRSLSVCLWPALLPFSVNRFRRNLVTRALLWSSLAATIMVQIGHWGIVRCLFENFKKILKNHRIRISEFWPIIFLHLCLLCIFKKVYSIRTKLTEEIDFEVCPCADSGNGTAAAARRLAGYSVWTGGAAACSDRSSEAFWTGGIQNWGRNRSVKTIHLVASFACWISVDT